MRAEFDRVRSLLAMCEEQGRPVSPEVQLPSRKLSVGLIHYWCKDPSFTDGSTLIVTDGRIHSAGRTPRAPGPFVQLLIASAHASRPATLSIAPVSVIPRARVGGAVVGMAHTPRRHRRDRVLDRSQPGPSHNPGPTRLRANAGPLQAASSQPYRRRATRRPRSPRELCEDSFGALDSATEARENLPPLLMFPHHDRSGCG